MSMCEWCIQIRTILNFIGFNFQVGAYTYTSRIQRELACSRRKIIQCVQNMKQNTTNYYTIIPWKVFFLRVPPIVWSLVKPCQRSFFFLSFLVVRDSLSRLICGLSNAELSVGSKFKGKGVNKGIEACPVCFLLPCCLLQSLPSFLLPLGKLHHTTVFSWCSRVLEDWVWRLRTG